MSQLEEASADLSAPIRAWLGAICEEPQMHARFLNTLSLMEHIGSRKIMATQDEPRQDTLKHLAEETRHAFFFKRAAEKLAKHSLDYEPAETLSGMSARQYMGRLDAHIAANLPEAAPEESAYLYMSLIVELRAIWFYKLYRAVLAERGVDLSLKSVLAEEELHLSEMTERLAKLDSDWEWRTGDFCAYEQERFRVLWDALRAQSHAPMRAAS